MNARTAIETFTDFNETQKFFKQFKVGDYVDRALNTVLKFVSIEHNIHIGESGDYVVDNWFVKPAAALYNLTLGDAIDTFSSLENTKAFMAQFKVGDFTQELTYAASRVIDHDMEYDEESDTYYATGWYEIIASAIYDMNARTAIETFTNVTEAKLFFRQFRVGDYVDRIVNIVSSAVSMQHNVHFDDNGDYAADVWFVKPAAAIYNMTLGDAIDTFKSVNGAVEFVRRFKIGDFAADVANKTVALFVNHNAYYKADEDYYFVTGYFEPIADQIYNMDVSYALDTFTSLSAVKSYFYGFKVGDYVYDIVNDFVSNLIDQTVIRNADGSYTASGMWGTFGTKTYNKKVGDIVLSFIEGGPTGVLSDYLIGDLLADPIRNALDGAAISHTVVYTEETDSYAVGANLSTLCNYFYNKKVSAIISEGRELYNILIGDYLGDIFALIAENAPDSINVTVTKNGEGKYVARGDAAIILDLFVNQKLFDFIDKIGTQGVDYIMGDEMIGGLYAGNLFNYYYDAVADRWYTDPEMTTLVTFDSNTQKALMTTVYRARVKTVLEMDLDAIFGNLYVGALSGYICTKEEELGHIHDENCVWIRETEVYVDGEYGATQMLYVAIDPLDDCIANIKIGNVLNGSINVKTLVSGAKLGALFGLTRGGNGKWCYYKTYNGYRVVKEESDPDGYYSNDSGEKYSYTYLAGEESSTLYQSICEIDAEELFGSGAISTIMSEVKDLKIGYLMGYEWTDTIFDTDGETVLIEAGWYTDKTYNVQLSDMRSLLADFSVNDITSGSASYNSWKIGRLMGLTKSGEIWRDNSGTPATGVIGLLADLTVGDISSSTGFKKTIGKWHIGEILECFAFDKDISEGGVQVKFDGEKWRREDSTIATSIVWYKNVIDEENSTPSNTVYTYRKIEGVNAKVYSLRVSELLENDFNNLIADWTISEILSLDGTESGILKKISGMKVSEFSDDSALQTAINGWYIGDIMNKFTSDGGTTWYNDYDASTDVYGDLITGINAKLYSLKISDLSGGFLAAIDGWTLAEILNKDLSLASGIDALLLGKTVGELTSQSLDTIAADWYVGQIMKYKKYSGSDELVDYSDDGVWKNSDGDPADDKVQEFYNITIGQLMNSDFGDIVSGIIADWKVGTVLGYYEYGGEWYKDRTDNGNGTYSYDPSDKVTGVTSKLAKKKVSDLSGGFDALISEFTLGDLISTDGNRVLTLLADVALSDIPDSLNGLLVGSVMGYEKVGGVWEKDGDPADELTAVIADISISEFTQNGFMGTLKNNIMNNVSVGTFFAEAGDPSSENGFMALIDPDWKLGELTEKVGGVVKSANVYGLIRLNAFGTFLPYEITEGEVITANGGTSDDATVVAYYDPYYTGSSEIKNFDFDGDGIDEYSYTLSYADYKKLDSLFTNDYDNAITSGDIQNTDSEQSDYVPNVRSYWLNMSMPEFMAKLMGVLSQMTALIEDATNASYYAYCGGYAAAKGYSIESYEISKAYYVQYVDGGGDKSYQEFMEGYGYALTYTYITFEQYVTYLGSI